MAEQVAWIGLGNMGRGMIKNLVAKYPFQTPLIIYNRTQSRATELAPTLSKPVTVVPTIAEAVAPSSIIFICLSDDNAVTEALQTAISTCDIAGKLFVDCSTVHPDTSRSEAKLVELHGGSFVTCPVFGTAPVADAGQLVCVLAGKRDLVERVKPFCAGVMGRINLDVSTPPTGAAGNEDVVVDPGRASLLKIMGNSLGLNLVDAVAEAMTVAEKSGLGVDTLHNFLELMYPGIFTCCGQWECKSSVQGDRTVSQAAYSIRSVLSWGGGGVMDTVIYENERIPPMVPAMFTLTKSLSHEKL
ncbi:predicted protein [Histoplasma mississippiense (nom. inval.)]|uniref:predicted protein n=1 Tax=Ajellomyces capsulatus (strain NAm1 / WU24) TaxID=2059318 RepID=UPI000157CE0D|nr:predicted protein [Histoplasma mississippiense (nom. inval.)]EDN10669.1 predicted protein [Histoplasma mississippiense (nom. inval.)]